MASIGLSVPPGLTVSTEACEEYQKKNGKKLPDGLWEEILDGLKIVEKEIGAFLGDPSKPLLLSVRSGAAISMPGMMDTVLNLGLNDEVVAGLAAKSGERFAYDSFPDHHPKKQLQLAVQAVFDSWDSPRAIKYRSINQITGLMGTAVNIQCMVFGNMGNTSGTGVLFTRNPSTGEKKLYGEFLVNAQDIEFTVQESRLWMLQCRSGKRTGKGAVKIAVDMVNGGLIDARTAIKMVEPQYLEQILHPQFEDSSTYKDKVIAKGLPASPGAAMGQIVFSADDAEAWHAQGKSVILKKEDQYFIVVQVVVIGDKVISEGEWLSVNGSTGEVILGKRRLSPPTLSGDLETFMSWADKFRHLKVLQPFLL
ncbi:hypothetical protein HYC85_012855 [Camellia sinensis]|uniref:Pyruvate phosphate dikinase AMP/ATP-binding domain-containing protein n=1 Tax=Camellia sinensis TaxID=4442 RepID=A0A7J7HD49_CAMSI|nr:hypothetical protein HYC85_012855 [Camellia sinensis]